MTKGTLSVLPWEMGLQMGLSAILGSQMLNVCFTYVKEATSVWQSSILKYDLPKKYEIPPQQQETAFGVLQAFGLKALRSVFAGITCSFGAVFCFVSQREQK